MNTTEWTIDIHTLARTKGWWETPRPVGERFALIHSEASESLEALRRPELDGTCDKCDGAGCPKCGDSGEAIGGSRFLEELADVQIRLMDLAGFYHVDFSAELATQRLRVDAIWDISAPENLADAIDHLHSHICQCSLAQRLSNNDKWSTLTPCAAYARVFTFVDRIALEYGCDDLEPVIRQKHAYNQLRPIKHGKTF